ncbi:bud emergence protein 1 [Steccherinum ochraceum]|uniref:Bud emergence protein 1 n=1 Tax=Steccherinum ochraceum TaxID=92696 RepID=A0A4R0RT41_9APHY|nr:bud emergence protein 1 [Steccherinum ochraceum]
MKTLRKSLNGHKEHHISSPVSPLPSLSKPIGALQPPRKVIKALHSHRPTAPQQLPFEKGDFFHVISDLGGGQWYEAHNPMTGARGLVPRDMFEEFNKGGTTKAPTPKHTSASPKVQAYYAVVLHDFSAERPDELEAKAGDTVTVVAQSNREWFVAKPIGRLGRPGLIPVSFVEIRDPATGSPIQDVSVLIDGGVLPRVEDWKKSVMSYKANSISLGVLDEGSFTSISATPTNTVPVPLPPEEPSPPEPYQDDEPQPDEALFKTLPDGLLLAAEVQSFHFEMEEYWFRIHAIYQPYAPPGSNRLPPAKELVLFRSYNDFYDFQVELLNSHPYEAGRPDKQTRILPYMPGPADTVDNEITITRRVELDEYLKQLSALKRTARYILEHQLVREFLALKPGDAQQEVEARGAELQKLFQGGPERRLDSEIPTRMSHLSVSDKHDAQSDVSDYEDDHGTRAKYDSQYSYRPDDGVHPHVAPNAYDRPMKPLHIQTQPRPDSAASGYRSHGRTQSRTSSRTNSPLPHHARYPSVDTDPHLANGYSRSSLASSHEPSPVSMRSSQAPSSTSGRSRSQSSATLNTPSISATNLQTAFVKIKVFDKVSDDLVAIRVHPNVTYSGLMDKVQARLGGNVQGLSYRDSTGSMIGLESDKSLKYWLDSTERLVLFAD